MKGRSKSGTAPAKKETAKQTSSKSASKSSVSKKASAEKPAAAKLSTSSASSKAKKAAELVAKPAGKIPGKATKAAELTAKAAVKPAQKAAARKAAKAPAKIPATKVTEAKSKAPAAKTTPKAFPAPAKLDSKTKSKVDAKAAETKSAAKANSQPSKIEPAVKPTPAKSASAKAKPAASKETPPASSKKSTSVPQASPKANSKPEKAPEKQEKVAKPSAKVTAKKVVEEVVPSGPPTDPVVVEKLRAIQERKERSKDLARPQDARTSLVHSDPSLVQPPEPGTDRLVLMVRDPYWLHASWDISRRAVQRAKASLAGQWHSVKPILRLFHLDDAGTTANSEKILRDIEIHSGVRNWYIPVAEPPSIFVASLGYLCSSGRFHELCRSNKVKTPVPGSNDAIDDHWADIAKDAERVFSLSGGYEEDGKPEELKAMFEERLSRPMDGPTAADFGGGADGSLRRAKDFHFELDVEMVVFGATQPYAKLVIGGEPATVRADGTFSARVPMPNTRQVIPVTSRARDGSDEQTIVIAVERNTKVMEPVSSNNLNEPDE